MGKRKEGRLAVNPTEERHPLTPPGWAPGDWAKEDVFLGPALRRNLDEIQQPKPTRMRTRLIMMP